MRCAVRRGTGREGVGVDDPASPTARGAASIAAVLGIGSAAISAYWALGGTALLGTVSWTTASDRPRHGC